MKKSDKFNMEDDQNIYFISNLHKKFEKLLMLN